MTRKICLFGRKSTSKGLSLSSQSLEIDCASCPDSYRRPAALSVLTKFPLEMELFGRAINIFILNKNSDICTQKVIKLII